jgi:hypothetical protein
MAPNFTFQPARRENVSLLLGLSGGTGSGKTYSAMRIAKGLAGDKTFGVVDTEAGRSSFYADTFRFDSGQLKAPFTPTAYAEAIIEADAAGYPVIVVDSTSHEWAGDGGILDMQEAELERMAGSDWKKREAVKMASWIRPKSLHKAFLSKLLQVRAHVILCFRAEPKIEMVKEDGKMVVRAKQSLTGLDGWIPICEKNLPFELTASFLLLATAPGVPHPIKLPEQLRPFFPTGQVITETAGVQLAAWASGGSAPDLRAEYLEYIDSVIQDATDPGTFTTWWNSPEQKQQRQRLLTKEQIDGLKVHVLARVDALKSTAAAQPAQPVTTEMPAVGELFGGTK